MYIQFFKFFAWTAMWAWIWSDSAVRYGVPLISKFYSMLDEMANPAKPEGENGKTNYSLIKLLTFSLELLFSLLLAYVLMSWAVWCVLRCVLYTQGMDSGKWMYFLPGFFCCELALGKAAAALPYRNFMGVFPYTMAMGGFIVFALNYQPIRDAFPWLISFVGLTQL